MKRVVVLVTLILFLSINIYAKTNIKLFISKDEKTISITIMAYNYLSNDVISVLKAGEKAQITFSIVKQRLLNKKILVKKTMILSYDIMNNRYIVVTDKNKKYYDSLKELKNAISTVEFKIPVVKGYSKNLRGIIQVKSLTIVGVFGFIYKMFFKLNYTILFNIKEK